MILVAGPSCGGKTTYVRKHALPEDRVLDFGDILEELGQARYEDTDPQALAQAHALWRQRLPKADWVVWTAAKRIERGRFRSQFRAQTVIVMAPMAVCLARAERERPPSAQVLIRRWFSEYEPSSSGSDQVVMTG